jgi:hypothetical protein
MDNDTHDQWRAFNHSVHTITNALEQILANHPGINARQLFFQAVAKGLIESSADGYELVQRHMKKSQHHERTDALAATGQHL